MNNLILSSVEGLAAANIAPFVESIAATECQARKIMVAYDSNLERDGYLTANGWEVASAVRDPNLHHAVQRFHDWKTVLSRIEPTTLILSTDCRDVVFQADPFRMHLTAECYYPAWEGIMHSSDPWAEDTCVKNFQDEWHWLGGRKSYCAGTIIGGWRVMSELFGSIFRFAVTGLNHKSIPSDQAAYNILTNQHTTGKCAIPVPWFACTCGTWLVDKFKGALCDPPPKVDGWKVGDYALIHQYERVPGLAEAIVSHYCRPVEDEPAKTGEYAGAPEIREQSGNELVDRIKGKSVALVGPAQSLQHKGDEIDSHDIVVRMNRGFPPPPDEAEHIGSRTDALYHCLLEEYRCGGKIRWEEIKEARLLLCSPYPRGVAPFHSDVCKFMVANREHRVPWHMIDRDLYLDIARATGTRPNTGICAIVDLLANGADLTVYGFDFFETGWRTSYKVDERLPEYIASQFDGNHHQEPQRRLVEDLSVPHQLRVVKMS